MSDNSQKKLVIGLLIVVLLILLIIHYYPEGFATKREKAHAILNWSKNTGSPSYVNYRAALGGASDIVEYDGVMKLLHGRNLTLDNITGVI